MAEAVHTPGEGGAPDAGDAVQFRFRDDEPVTDPAVTVDAFLGQSNAVAVRIEPGDETRDLLPHLERIRLVEVNFPIFQDGRGYSAARILREAGYLGEMRAVGEVLVDQLAFMRRCGFDAFAPAHPLDEADAEQHWHAGRMSIRPRRTSGNRSGPCAMAEADPMVRGTARRRDRIEIGPAFTQADADALNRAYEGVETAAMLRDLFRSGDLGRVAVVSSFGTESAVLLHLVAEADRSIPVIFVDTLKMFSETLDYRETLIERLGIENASIVTPDPAVLAAKDENGLRWSWDPDGCCAIRKVEPLARAKRGLDAWISGRKAFQSVTRENLPRFEIEDGRLKINPLGNWTKDDLEAYFAEHDLPRHPLEAKGYLSVGCEPCTSAVAPGEDPRAGRWRGWDKVECGIHSPNDPFAGDDDLPPGYEPAF